MAGIGEPIIGSIDQNKGITMTALMLKISTDNDAFQPSPNTEIARILRAFADKLDSGAFNGGAVLQDANGNKVGEARLTSEHPDEAEARAGLRYNPHSQQFERC